MSAAYFSRILKLHSAGIVDALKKKWNKYDVPPKEVVPTAIEISQVVPIFSLVSIAILLSVTLLMSEKFYRKVSSNSVLIWN